MFGGNTSALQILCFSALVGLAVTTQITYKLSQRSGRYEYDTVFAMCLIECIKLLMACVLHIKNTGFDIKFFVDPIRKVPTRLLISYSLLALGYAVYNQLIFLVISIVDPGTFSLLKSFNPVLVSTLDWFFTGQKISFLQLLCVLVQVLAIVPVVLSPDPETCHYKLTYDTKGTLIMCFACIMGSINAVFNAHFVKQEKANIHVQNIILYVFGIIFNFAMYFILRTPNSSIFHGFRNVGVILLLLLNSCVGIAITLLYKYGNVLLKTMTTPVASGVLVFVSYLFFDLSLDIVKTVCAVNVIVDTVLFMNLPAPEQPKSFKVKNHNSRIMGFTTLFCILVGVNIIANESNSSQPSQTKSMPKNLSKNTLGECHHDSCKSLRNNEKDLPFREFPINFATITADDARRGAMNIWASLALSERLSTMLEYIPSMKNLDVSEQLHIYSKTMMYKPKERLQDGPLFESNAGFAIILHGNARSLLSIPIQAFWKEWMSMRNDHGVVVFDVMDYNPIDNVQEIRSLVSSENSLEDANETDVAKAFTNLGITRIRVSKVATQLRKIPQNGSLHAILDNEYLRKTMNQKTGSLAYSTKKVIGLDTMIKWESKEKRQFSHVIFMQADLIYTPFVDNYRHGKSFFNDMNKMQDISFVVNDIVGITPRRHAMSYVSTINLNAAHATRDELLRANQTNQMMYKDFTGASTVALPHTQLSIDGFLFTGNRLYLGDNSDVVSKHRNLIEDILPFHMDNELLLFVREMNNTVCVEDKTMNLWLSKRNIKIDIC